MGRSKEQWSGQLSGYGPTYEKGAITGFHVQIKADDHTKDGRYVTVLLDARTLRQIADAAQTVEDHPGESFTVRLG